MAGPEQANRTEAWLREKLAALEAADRARGLPSFPTVPTSPDPTLDRRGGAPASVRMAIGASSDGPTRLAALRARYPDAMPYGDDNFVFTDPRTGRPTLYAPSPFADPVGAAASLVPEAGEMVGGALGGAAGGLFGGGLPGAAVGGAAGATAGRELAERAARNLFGIDDRRSAGQQAADALTTAGVNLAAPIVGRALVGAVTAPLRYAGGARMVEPASDTLQAATRQGVELGVGPMTGNTTLQRLEAGLAQYPGGTGPVTQRYETAVAQLDGRVGEVAQTIADAGGRIAGAAVPAGQEGLRVATQAAALRGIQAYEAELGRQLTDIGARVGARPIVPTATLAQAPVLQAALGQAAESLEPRYRDALDVLGRLERDLARAGGAVTFDTLRQVRTTIGDLLEDQRAGVISATGQQALRQVQRAIGDDLGAAATAAGPEAAAAWQAHNGYVAAFRARGGPGEILARLGDETKAGNADLLRLATSSGKQGTRELAALRGQASEADWRAVVAGLTRELGTARAGAQNATGDVFSPAEFLTNWQKLTPEARRILFGGGDMAPVMDDLTDLARLSGALKDAGRVTNWSHTSGATAWQAILGTLGTVGAAQADSATLAAVGGSMLAANAGARVLSTPGVARALVRLGRAATVNDQTFIRELGRVAAIAAENEWSPEVQAVVGRAVDQARDLVAPRLPTPRPGGEAVPAGGSRAHLQAVASGAAPAPAGR